MKLLFALLFVFSSTAYGFPEMIRHGYMTCSSCHVSPVGGGALTPYGRGAAEDVLSTWSADGEGQPLFGLAGQLPSWLDVGGDARGVQLKSIDQQGNWVKTYIPMQDDAEVAVQVPYLPQVTVDASVGVYGPQHTVEYRRAYLKADLGPNFSFRAGRFLAAYGVNMPDHTVATREPMGLGEGGETYNAEFAWTPPAGQSILTFIYGDQVTITADPRDGYNNKQGQEMSGASWRNALFVGDIAQVGVSYLGVSNFDSYRQAYGLFVQTGITTHGYFLGEYDRKFENGIAEDLGLAKFGWEMKQGLFATIEGDVAGVEKEARVGLQWFPRPHWELLLEERRTWPGQGQPYLDTGLLMLHHYL